MRYLCVQLDYFGIGVLQPFVFNTKKNNKTCDIKSEFHFVIKSGTNLLLNWKKKNLNWKVFELGVQMKKNC